MANKYKVMRFTGVPLAMDDAGNYVIKKDENGNFKLHTWRIGKHTRGHFHRIGQVFLTENRLRVAIVQDFSVSFNKRHRYTPMERFLDDYVDKKVIDEAESHLD
ncbi:DUF7671 family protein [Fructilactobacillus fructivorans]|nr:hypothetical protein [Fructilactobacillus fructivorans]KRN40850.1 hypothetical protein IV51_GL001076 [Fructilactobacillus fructivorans]KRN42444.1 hypothetical protein IV48_GL000206 [Fructilactobacillus fructivorans]MCT0151149.1 hypothetical protein [Fructilactobacillus fructivorans]MCT2867293.1 hypothetical protein [Fructilactobacillus fructivorans]MCT2869187.1 hypothetical protein [Fructilactobacillus fructivorans]